MGLIEKILHRNSQTSPPRAAVAPRSRQDAEISSSASSLFQKLYTRFENRKGSSSIVGESVEREATVKTGSEGKTIGAISSDRKWSVQAIGDKVRVRDVQNAEQGANEEFEMMLSGHEEQITDLAFSADGEYIVSGSLDRTAKVWHRETGCCVATFKHKKEVLSVAFSHDSQLVTTGSAQGEISVWQKNDGKLLATKKGEGVPVWALAFSSDVNLLFASNGKVVEIIQMLGCPTPAVKTQFVGHKSGVVTIASSPEGKIVSKSMDGELRCWENSVKV